MCPTTLFEAELHMIHVHPEADYTILGNIDFPWPIAESVYQHHERIVGSGYPRGLCSDEILFEAKIIAVADVVEAMSSHRPYRAARTQGRPCGSGFKNGVPEGIRARRICFRQREIECRSLPARALGPHFSSMPLDRLPHDGQTYAASGILACGIEPLETVKYLACMFRIEAYAVILDEKCLASVVRRGCSPYTDVHALPHRGKFQGILQQILDHHA